MSSVNLPLLLTLLSWVRCKDFVHKRVVVRHQYVLYRDTTFCSVPAAHRRRLQEVTAANHCSVSTLRYLVSLPHRLHTSSLLSVRHMAGVSLSIFLFACAAKSSYCCISRRCLHDMNCFLKKCCDNIVFSPPARKHGHRRHRQETPGRVRGFLLFRTLGSSGVTEPGYTSWYSCLPLFSPRPGGGTRLDAPPV